VKIITSPLTRAIETAVGAFPDTKIPILVEPSCREMLDTACDIGRVPAELAEQFLPQADIDFSQLDPFWWLEVEKFPRTGPGNAPPANIVVPKTPDEVMPLRETEEELDARIREFVAKLRERPEQHIAVVGHSSYFKRMLAMSRKLNNCELFETSLGAIQLRYTQ
jgi:broad specificity phosphatase PhoE